MRKIILCLFFASYSILATAQTAKSLRLHNWITTLRYRSAIHHIMVMGDGQLYTWQAGGIPAPIPDFNNALQVSAGMEHVLVLKTDGTVWAWGINDYYQLGNKALNTTQKRMSETPVQVTGLKDVTAISAFRNSSYALLKDGSVWAWGSGGGGMSGDGGKIISSSSIAEISGKMAPVKVQGLENVVAIAGAMALLKDGTVWIWGDGSYGRLGNNTIQTTSVPVKAIGVNNAVAIATLNDGAVALLADGTVMAWGNNYKGQLGNGVNVALLRQDSPVARSLVPVKVKISNVKDIDAATACLAIMDDGTVKGWGWGNLSALGPLGGDATPNPVKVFDLKNVGAVKAGNGAGFALLTDGTLVGWGSQMVATGVYKQSNKVIKIAEFGKLAPKAK